MKNTNAVSPASLRRGYRIRFNGRIYTVRAVRRSLGNGYQVRLADGPGISGMITAAKVTDA